MKANKVLIIIQTILMYVSILSLLSTNFVNKSGLEKEAISQINNALCITYLASLAILLLLCVINIILGAVSTLHEVKDSSMTVMICKIIQIPWFIMNFVFCLIMIILMINPFLLIAAPIVLLLSVLSTYLFMFSSSSLDIFYLAKSRKFYHSSMNLLSFIFLFIFVLDVVGSILIYHSLKSEKKVLQQENH